MPAFFKQNRMVSPIILSIMNFILPEISRTMNCIRILRSLHTFQKQS